MSEQMVLIAGKAERLTEVSLSSAGPNCRGGSGFPARPGVCHQGVAALLAHPPAIFFRTRTWTGSPG